MENRKLKEIIIEIVINEKLEDYVINKNNVSELSTIKVIIDKIFKKYKTFDYIEGLLFDIIYYGNNVDTNKFEKSEKNSLEAFENFIADEVLSLYYNIIEKDSILYLVSFLIDNKVEIFLNELKCLPRILDNIPKDEIVAIISEAEANTRANVRENEKIDYYEKFIRELSESLNNHIN